MRLRNNGGQDLEVRGEVELQAEPSRRLLPYLYGVSRIPPLKRVEEGRDVDGKAVGRFHTQLVPESARATGTVGWVYFPRDKKNICLAAII